MLRNGLVVACSGLLLGSVAAAQTPTLNIGDPAPALQVSEWVKGQPVDLAAQKGKGVTVVEFWATWCGPCVQSIPHLTKLQQEFGPKGVTVIGLTSADDNNTLPIVKEFVQKRGEKMGYTVAFEQETKTYEAYMDAAGEGGIPTAFVIDKEGRVAWIGHPMDGLDEAIEETLVGKVDFATARKVRDLERTMQESSMTGNQEQSLKAAEELIALKPTHSAAWRTKYHAQHNDPGNAAKAEQTAGAALAALKPDPVATAYFAADVLSTEPAESVKSAATAALKQAAEAAPENVDVRLAYFSVLADSGRDEEALAWAAETVQKVKGDAADLSLVAQALSFGDHATKCSDLAAEAIELAISLEPDNPSHLQQKFYILAVCKGDTAKAEAAGRYLVEKAADDANLLNGFAWMLLYENPQLKGKYNALALAAAERANQVSGGNDWGILDTLALAKFETGAVDEAIALEKKAIDLCTNELFKGDMRASLARFEAARQK